MKNIIAILAVGLGLSVAIGVAFVLATTPQRPLKPVQAAAPAPVVSPYNTVYRSTKP